MVNFETMDMQILDTLLNTYIVEKKIIELTNFDKDKFEKWIELKYTIDGDKLEEKTKWTMREINDMPVEDAKELGLEGLKKMWDELEEAWKEEKNL